MISLETSFEVDLDKCNEEMICNEVEEEIEDQQINTKYLLKQFGTLNKESKWRDQIDHICLKAWTIQIHETNQTQMSLEDTQFSRLSFNYRMSKADQEDL